MIVKRMQFVVVKLLKSTLQTIFISWIYLYLVKENVEFILIVET